MVLIVILLIFDQNDVSVFASILHIESKLTPFFCGIDNKRHIFHKIKNYPIKFYDGTLVVFKYQK